MGSNRIAFMGNLISFCKYRYSNCCFNIGFFKTIKKRGQNLLFFIYYSLVSKLFLFFSLIVPSLVSAQNITGIWRGKFTINDAATANKKESVVQYNYEIQLIEKSAGELVGTTYTYRTQEYFGKANFKGTISGNRKYIVISETAITAVEKQDKTDVCVMVCNLQYSMSNAGEQLLSGTFTSKNIKSNSSCFSGDVLLKRVAIPVFPLEEFLKKAPASSNRKSIAPTPMDTGSMKKSQPVSKKKYLLELPEEVLTKQTKNVPQEVIKTPIEILQRENAVLASVLQPEQEVTVFIYDNGIVDSDIISVFVDANKIFNKVPLSEKAISFPLTFSEKITQHQIVTYAENMGDIPPNTGLLVIKAGKKMIEIPIMSDFQKNAKIIINYQANCKVAVERFN